MTHENERNVEVLVVLLDIVGVIVGRLPFVDGVEVESRVIVLDRWEERFESILEAISVQLPATQPTQGPKRTTLDRFAVVTCPVRPYRP